MGSMPVKTDRNDARALAQIVRTGWFRAVHVKSAPCRSWRALLTGRRMVLNKLRDLENGVRAALREAEARTGGSMALTTPDGGLPLSLSVAPVRVPELLLLGGAPAVIVCVTDLDSGVRLPEQRLRDVFGLTPAEARMALALFEGATLAEAAESLRISRFTAQNHLARIFEKTGTNRQAVLIKLMMRAVGLDFGGADLEPRGHA